MKRGKRASKRLDVRALRDAVRDRRMWAALAVVVKPDGEQQHFRIVDGDVLVDVETQPDLLDLTCRLSSAFGGPGQGLWAIPPVGAEVAILMPGGNISFMPMIVAVLSSGGVPDRVSESRTILVSTGEVEITAPVVRLGPSPDTMSAPLDTLVHGTGIDPFTGAQYHALGNTSSKVLVKK